MKSGVAVVIGGGGGIGRGVALALAFEGMAMVIADIDGAAAALVGDEIRARGGCVRTATVDATSQSDLDDLASSVSALGGPSLLACTVGVTADRRLDEADEADWAWMLETNLLSAVRVVNAFLPRLRSSDGRAHILLTASLAALVAPPPSAARNRHLGLYIASKHALLGYAEALRNELAPENIGVSLLSPGRVKTNLLATSGRFDPRASDSDLRASWDDAHDEHAMSGEEVGKVVVRGIDADRFHILTHPEALAAVEARHEGLVDDFKYFAGLQ